MNERIRLLSEQAQLHARQGMAKTVIELKRYDADVASERYAKDFEEKFAELIVRECYEHCKGQVLDKEVADTNELTYNDAVSDCANGLLQHFGVDE